MKTILRALLLQIVIQPQIVTTTELPLTPTVSVAQGQAAVLRFSVEACLRPIVIRGEQYRCRPDRSVIVGIPANEVPGTYPVTTPDKILIAALDVTATAWPQVQRSAGTAAKPAPPGRLEHDRAAKNAAYQAHATTRWQSYHLQLPIKIPINEEFRISDPFGMQRFYGAATTPSIHSGVDLAPTQSGSWTRTPPSVHSMAPGMVVLAQSLWLEGNTVIVYHGDALYTTYCHLKTISPGIAPGAFVSAGQAIGFVGSTGHSSAPHLHLAMRIHNVAVDPLTAQATLNRALH